MTKKGKEQWTDQAGHVWTAEWVIKRETHIIRARSNGGSFDLSPHMTERQIESQLSIIDQVGNMPEPLLDVIRHYQEEQKND